MVYTSGEVRCGSTFDNLTQFLWEGKGKTLLVPAIEINNIIEKALLLPTV